MTVSKHPTLERSPGKADNWVEQTGGLPAYIDKIARALHYERGKSISVAIATAVEAVRKWAAGGGNVNPDTRAKAQAALAAWEAKKAAAKARRASSTDMSTGVDHLDVLDLAGTELEPVVWVDLALLDDDEWALVDLAPGDHRPPYHWKHGYIPITPAAALSQAKGNRTRASKLLAKGQGISPADASRKLGGMPTSKSRRPVAGERGRAKRARDAAKAPQTPQGRKRRDPIPSHSDGKPPARAKAGDRTQAERRATLPPGKRERVDAKARLSAVRDMDGVSGEPRRNLERITSGDFDPKDRDQANGALVNLRMARNQAKDPQDQLRIDRLVADIESARDGGKAPQYDGRLAPGARLPNDTEVTVRNDRGTESGRIVSSSNPRKGEQRTYDVKHPDGTVSHVSERQVTPKAGPGMRTVGGAPEGLPATRSETASHEAERRESRHRNDLESLPWSRDANRGVAVSSFSEPEKLDRLEAAGLIKMDRRGSSMTADDAYVLTPTGRRILGNPKDADLDKRTQDRARASIASREAGGSVTQSRGEADTSPAAKAPRSIVKRPDDHEDRSKFAGKSTDQLKRAAAQHRGAGRTEKADELTREVDRRRAEGRVPGNTAEYRAAQQQRGLKPGNVQALIPDATPEQMSEFSTRQLAEAKHRAMPSTEAKIDRELKRRRSVPDQPVTKSGAPLKPGDKVTAQNPGGMAATGTFKGTNEHGFHLIEWQQGDGQTRTGTFNPRGTELTEEGRREKLAGQKDPRTGEAPRGGSAEDQAKARAAERGIAPGAKVVTDVGPATVTAVSSRQVSLEGPNGERYSIVTGTPGYDRIRPAGGGRPKAPAGGDAGRKSTAPDEAEFERRIANMDKGTQEALREARGKRLARERGEDPDKAPSGPRKAQSSTPDRKLSGDRALVNGQQLERVEGPDGRLEWRGPGNMPVTDPAVRAKADQLAPLTGSPLRAAQRARPESRDGGVTGRPGGGAVPTDAQLEDKRQRTLEAQGRDSEGNVKARTSSSNPDAPVRVEHTPDGTLVHGTERSDAPQLKAAGFKWSRNLGAWYLPRTWGQDTRERRVKMLEQSMGDRVGVDRTEGPRKSAAERDAEKRERAAGRAERMEAKSEKRAAEAERRFEAADLREEKSGIPFGQPILVGHHSERKHRRALDRAHANMGKGVEAQRDAERAGEAAERARRTAAGDESKVTIGNRIAKNEAEVRRLERKINGTGKAIHGEDKPATGDYRARLERLRDEAQDQLDYDRGKLAERGGVPSAETVGAGDFVKVSGIWYPVDKANAKSVRVPNPMIPGRFRTAPYREVTEHRKAGEVSREDVARMVQETSTAFPHIRAELAKRAPAKTDKPDVDSPREGTQAAPRPRGDGAGGAAPRGADRAGADTPGTPGKGEGDQPAKLTPETARRLSDDQLEKAIARLMADGEWGSPSLAVLEAELDRRDRERQGKA